ncbi:MAG TPA: hypothetical protein DD390_00360 [Rhodospirillaceae bacterium]|nr:hypothetical protein [Rhodospirillaceae bacterium]MAX61911.1 hypothetical protein [Rhodospirillaceae bacterium]HBM11125.1 hypothetical protein [Rhodospirillaceae bacterium]
MAPSAQAEQERIRHKASTQLGNIKTMAMKLSRTARINLANRLLKLGHELIASADAESECRGCGKGMQHKALLCDDCDAIVNPMAVNPVADKPGTAPKSALDPALTSVSVD